ncbi:Uncharacterized conserved protein, DUF1697 family [Fodinibius roseus]|uniref:Uncharacterized conserved protein, DUF1697 family n=1 Tax=Fodinibius roseus TaxID=1194090 RepID=A0A1M5ESY9_9BACT|nr:DUF1697 domain-containing protein [Fodinibius roseus]SHF82250.1 Uncharacterized conserved protein, DUF1697 family [Fodinibius roseus]
MNTYIALFRGINVGGHNKLLMKDLRNLMSDLGYHNVDTYIQTGNVVFQSEDNDKQNMSGRISTAVEEHRDFKPKVLVLELEEMQKAIEDNPFPKAEAEPKSLHLSFLVSEPEDPDLNSLEEYKKESEQFELKGRVFYLHAPEGIGRSKMAGKIGKALGVSMTGRNWRTVQKIMEMVEEIR